MSKTNKPHEEGDENPVDDVPVQPARRGRGRPPKTDAPLVASLNEKVPDPDEPGPPHDRPKVPLYKTIPSKHSDEDPVEAALANEMKEQVEKLLRNLPSRHRTIMELYFGEENLTLEEIGNRLGVSGVTVAYTRDRIFKKIRDSHLRGFLEDYIPGKKPVDIARQEEKQTAYEKRLQKNAEILKEVGPDISAQKQVIADTFLQCGIVGITDMFEIKTGIPARSWWELTHPEQINTRDLKNALGETVIANIKKLFKNRGITATQLSSFEEAVTQLRSLMARFTEKGGE